MKKIYFLPFALFLLFSCSEPPNNSSSELKTEQDSLEQGQNAETVQMVNELRALIANTKPGSNYTWNKELAQLELEKIQDKTSKSTINNWYNYCYQLLLAGENKTVINEINRFFGNSSFPHKDLLNKSNKAVCDLLALAYLRQGERENCQLNHSVQSCIIPLQEGGVHQLKEGSQKAIEIYQVLQDQFPNPRYKWIINVAYMTLGEYPQRVPKKYFIEIPSKNEQKNFPAFNDVAMNLGLAHDGYAGSTCIDDFNNDGFLDVFVTSSGMLDNVQLFINDQKGGFINTTKMANLEGIVGGFNCIQADYDNDGDKDIFILRGAWLGKAGNHPNSLLKNMGDGSFQDVTRSSKLLSYHPTQTACWGDFDNDGYLDLFIGNESRLETPHPSELYKNNKDGTFSKVAGQRFEGKLSPFIKAAAWGDINNDGWLDLYISRLGGKNLLFKNSNGYFIEISKSAGVSEPIQSFPSWFWDVNNDGFEDLLVLPYDLSEPGMAGQYAQELQNIDVKAEKPLLYINNGDETFSESSKEFGISTPIAAMGSNFGDIDNDGFLDFYVGTGAPKYTAIVPNRMFRNKNGQGFEEVTSAGNFGHIQKGHGIAFADLDRDGDQDIYAVMGGFFEGDNFTNVLYENPISDNNWIVIELEGTETNRSAIGTKIELKLDDGTKLFRMVTSGGSFGASPLQQEIGLGKATKIDSLIIHWPIRKKQIFQDIEPNQKIKVKEGKNEILSIDYSYTPFAKSSKSIHKHH